MKRLIITLLMTFTLFMCMPCTAYSDEFPVNELSFGYYNDRVYTADIRTPPSPLFWHASLKINHGLMYMYQHLIYHTEKRFTLYAGASGSRWTRGCQNIGAFSGFLSMKFWLFRTPYVEPYFLYSIAGPTIITRKTLGRRNLGQNFLFQDFIGFGMTLGKKRRLDIEAKVVHYSNGDIFTQNPGFDIPIVFSIGVTF